MLWFARFSIFNLMKSILDIALIQSDLVWENPAQNRSIFTEKIDSLSQKVDLVILPEMFSTGFTMNAAEVAEPMSGATIQWLKEMSMSKDVAITGSLVIEASGKYYNRLVFMFPDGSYTYYDKHQLFTLAKEQEVFESGQKELIIDYKGWKIKPQICYDLRFPVWARNTTNYDVLLYVASWPKPRINAWDVLLQARAIENMSYCIGVNRIGLDGKGYEYNGHSAIYDVLGNALTKQHPLEIETTIYATLDKDHIKRIRTKLPFLEDRDNFELI